MPAPLIDPQLSQAVRGEPVLLGTIVVNANAKSNSDTAAPFNATGDALCGKTLLIQPDAACFIKQLATAGGTAASAANGLKLAADEKYVMCMRRDKGFLSVFGAAAANVKVFELNG